MKIQSNYVNNYKAQPAFKARFCTEDAETRDNLISLAHAGTYRADDYNAKAIWALINELEKIDTDDKLLVTWNKSREQDEIKISNCVRPDDSTPVTLVIKKDYTDEYWGTHCSYYIKDDWKKELQLIDEDTYYDKVASALYRAIFSSEGLRALFPAPRNYQLKEDYRKTINRYANDLDKLVDRPGVISEIEMIDNINNQFDNLSRQYGNADKEMRKILDKKLHELDEEIKKNHKLRMDLGLMADTARVSYVCAKIDTMA